MPAAGLAAVREIVLPRPLYAAVVSHVVRKFTGYYVDGEHHEQKAFGVLAGDQRGQTVYVRAVFPLITNMRYDPHQRVWLDEVVSDHAIPSATPLEQRGWVADPRELMAVEEICENTGWVVFGNYHTHRVPWAHDQLRDTCTRLDRELAADSGQWTFICSAVDLHHTRLRAFFEGDNGCEAAVRVVPAEREAAEDAEHAAPVEPAGPAVPTSTTAPGTPASAASTVTTARRGTLS